MEFPLQLKEAIEELTNNEARAEMARAAETLTNRYKTESGAGASLVTKRGEALAYAAVRMPATFGAVSAALEATIAAAEGFHPRTLLDAGAGTGAASWCAQAMTDCEEVVCLEREDAMRELGALLMQNGPQALREARWEPRDLAKETLREEADLVIASYVLNEMTERDREKAALSLWRAAKGVLLLVEPGTPEGFRQLRKTREILLGEGARIAAPCPDEKQCPMREDDWCHFSRRIARGKLHKALKGGEAPYEDEKFSYMAFTRLPCKRAKTRVLRHPYVEKGKITLYACEGDGVRQIMVTKRDAEVFRAARKARSGDAL